ncbi:MAG TPA: hypothetical protein VNA11_14085 [Pseudonocardia sp.]|nr:hypothetical protein [Pseudonocardia sp.]
MATHRRARTVAAIGAVVAAGTVGLMALAVGTAAATDEPADPAPAASAVFPPAGRTAAATTVFHPPYADPVDAAGAPGSGSGGTPSTTPSADPTPGS